MPIYSAAPAPLLFHHLSDQIRTAAKNMNIEANTRGLLLFVHLSHLLVSPVLCLVAFLDEISIDILSYLDS